MLKLAELLSLFLDDRKVIPAKVKANVAYFWLCDKFNATVIDPVASGKWKSVVKDRFKLKF